MKITSFGNLKLNLVSFQEINESVFHSGFPPQQQQQQEAFNPFDVTDEQVQSQGGQFQECDIGEKGLEEFLAEKDKECLERNKFLQEEPMEEPQNTSILSGISDKSIVLRNDGLWAGNTSGVNLDKLREETRISRCEYFRHNSSRSVPFPHCRSCPPLQFLSSIIVPFPYCRFSPPLQFLSSIKVPFLYHSSFPSSQFLLL